MRPLSPPLVVELPIESEEPLQFIAGTDVVARKYVQTAESAQHHVLSGPATDAVDARQPLEHLAILGVLQNLEVQDAIDDFPRGGDDRACLREAETEALELGRIHGGELRRARERVKPTWFTLGHPPVSGGESVEQMDTDIEGQLLAGDAVDQPLEDGRKAWRPQAAHTGDEPIQRWIGCGHRRESREVDL